MHIYYIYYIYMYIYLYIYISTYRCPDGVTSIYKEW